MKKPRRESWLRDVARIVLLSAAMIGVPAAGWAIAAHRKHIEAYYWAWVWTNDSKPAFNLRLKLAESRVPRDAYVQSLNFAYRQSRGERREWAARYLAQCHLPRSEMAGLRGLYRHVIREQDEDSCATRVLEEELRTLCVSEIPLVYEEEGFANVNWHPAEPPDKEADCFATTSGMSFDFGSYHVDQEVSWHCDANVDGTKHWRVYRRYGVVTRLPGPWRALLPIPPPRPPRGDYDEL